MEYFWTIVLREQYSCKLQCNFLRCLPINDCLVFFSPLYQISDMGTLKLKFHQFLVITASFEAETSRLSWGHEESSVYAAAMLKSQTVWFMAAGRDRDQRSVSCWVCSRFPLAPLPSLPGTQHRARPPGPSGRIRGILSTHLLTALQLLTPMGMLRVPPALRMRPPCSTVSERKGGREAAMSRGSRQFGWWEKESVRNGTLLREWVILDRAAVIRPAQQRLDHLFLSRPLLDEI